MRSEADIKQAIELLREGIQFAVLGLDPETVKKLRMTTAASISGLQWAMGGPSHLDELLHDLKTQIPALNRAGHQD